MTGPEIHLPSFVRQPSGLWVPLVTQSDGSGAMPVFARPDAAGLLVASRERFDPFEYVMRVVPAEDDLGLRTTSLGELVADIAELPFDWLIYQLARIARNLHGRRTAERQL